MGINVELITKKDLVTSGAGCGHTDWHNDWHKKNYREREEVELIVIQNDVCSRKQEKIDGVQKEG